MSTIEDPTEVQYLLDSYQKVLSDRNTEVVILQAKVAKLENKIAELTTTEVDVPVPYSVVNKDNPLYYEEPPPPPFPRNPIG